MKAERITLRIEPNIKRWLETKAEQERRSLSRQAEKVLAEAMERDEDESQRRSA